MSMSPELSCAYDIVRKARPSTNPETSCMLVAAAVAGMRGLTLRHIRIGSLFWPDQFSDDPMLSMRGGWGCEGFSAHDNKLWLSDDGVHDDGGFCGHTWLEPTTGSVIDVMHGVEDARRESYGQDWKVFRRYIPRPTLERAVKGFWKTEMQRCIKLGKAAK